MTRPMRWLVLAILVAPAVTYGVYRLGKGLGFFDPPWNREHEYRRTIVVALFAFLLFLPIFLFGWAAAWPRVWATFGVVNGFALLVFVGLGGSAAWKLWKLRHPPAAAPPAALETAAAEPNPESPAEKPLV
jgi:hypothetical protein